MCLYCTIIERGTQAPPVLKEEKTSPWFSLSLCVCTTLTNCIGSVKNKHKTNMGHPTHSCKINTAACFKTRQDTKHDYHHIHVYHQLSALSSTKTQHQNRLSKRNKGKINYFYANNTIPKTIHSCCQQQNKGRQNKGQHRPALSITAQENEQLEPVSARYTK